jgi:hypothetical protein
VIREGGNKMKWYLRACPICGGDAHAEAGDQGALTCFQCGRSVLLDEGSGRMTGAEPSAEVATVAPIQALFESQAKTARSRLAVTA